MIYYSPMPHFASLPAFLSVFIPVLIVVIIWTTVLKGFALWHAARNNQRNWFITLLVANTLGILEIVYLIWFRPSSSATVVSQAPASEPSPEA